MLTIQQLLDRYAGIEPTCTIWFTPKEFNDYMCMWVLGPADRKIAEMTPQFQEHPIKVYPSTKVAVWFEGRAYWVERKHLEVPS